MSDVGTFPTLVDGIIHNTGPSWTFTAGEDVKAGQLVGFAAAGGSLTVVAMDRTKDEVPIGVAQYDIASGEKGSILLPGCIVTVVNADDTTVIDAGDSLIQNDNSIKGTVSSATGDHDAGAPTPTDDYIVGNALEDIAGGGTGKALLNHYYVPV